LLSHALLETWQRRRKRFLTFDGYIEAGGIQGAITETAERTYSQLTFDQQRIARHIFLRLTQLGDGTQPTRRRSKMSDIISSS
jgi:hypothetical protein